MEWVELVERVEVDWLHKLWKVQRRFRNLRVMLLFLRGEDERLHENRKDE